MNGNNYHFVDRYGSANNDVYRDHKSTFVLDEITCSGNETMLSQCSHSPWLEHHCVSFQNYYAGVCCSNDSSFGGRYRFDVMYDNINKGNHTDIVLMLLCASSCQMTTTMLLKLDLVFHVSCLSILIILLFLCQSFYHQSEKPYT